MMKKGILGIFILFFTLSNFNFVLAQQNSVELHFFYSPFCHYCLKQKEFLKELKEKYPEVEIKEYDVITYSENQKILKDFYEKYKVPEREKGVIPVTFIKAKYFIGFNEQIGKEIEGYLKEEPVEKKPPQKVKIPLLGEINLSEFSLPVVTVVLGALDGLNPCAMWVLLFLIALLINIRSRKRMWLVGGTFILASGVVYFLILSAWLNLFLAIPYVNLTRILIGVFALGVGIWQIKNFITYHPGVCKVLGISSKIEEKLKLREKAEKIVTAPLTFGIIGGLIILALGVNLVEFFCSAGLPAIYTRILALNPLSTFSYYFYLLLYTFVFMLDDLIVFSLAVITLSRIGFTHRYNYWATLIGGLLIFGLGILLIFKPEFLIFA